MVRTGFHPDVLTNVTSPKCYFYCSIKIKAGKTCLTKYYRVQYEHLGNTDGYMAVVKLFSYSFSVFCCLLGRYSRLKDDRGKIINRNQLFVTDQLLPHDSRRYVFCVTKTYSSPENQRERKESASFTACFLAALL